MLNKNGFDSKLLLFNNNDFETISVKIRKLFNRILKKLIKIIFFIDNEDSINFGLIPSSFLAKLIKQSLKSLIFTGRGNEIISIKQISKINGCVIWTLHDMWPYSAVEHYINEKYFVKNYVENRNKLNFF